MPHKLGFYIRVSTEEQALRMEGSLDNQRHRLTGYVDVRNLQSPGWGVIVEQYIDDGFSAKDTNRPGLQKMLRDLEFGKIDMVLVTDLSRLSRSIRDFCGLLDIFKETKAKFLSLKEQFDTSTAAGEMMLFNMINLAQFERRQISERVSLNFHSRALRGLRNGGGFVLGYGVDPANKSIMVVQEEEASSVRLAFDTFIEEGSLYRAARKLRELNVPTKSSFTEKGDQGQSVWNTQLLLSTLRNYSYIGQREVNKGNKSANQESLQPHERYQRVKAAWPAIVDDITFFTAQKILDENVTLERTRRSKSKNRSFLLTSIARCGQCGRALVGSTGHGRTKEVRYYIHRPLEGKAVTCSVKRWRADEYESLVVDHLNKIVDMSGYLDGVERKIAEQELSGRKGLMDRRLVLERAIKKADDSIRKLVRLQMDEDDESLQEIYSGQLKETKAQRDLKNEQLKELNEQIGETNSPKEAREAIEFNLTAFQKGWKGASDTVKKQLLRAVLGNLSFNPSRLDISYHSVRAALVGGLTYKSSIPTPKNSAATKEGKLLSFGPIGQKSHNSMGSGWYIERVGCGDRF